MPILFSTIKNKIPLTSGVYFFRDCTGTILYIGKATNLRARLSSYFMRGAALDAAKQHMLEKAAHIAWQETDTEIEALLREASLIKQHLPPYNIALRDDKQYLFVGFTKEPFPRILFTHQPIAFVKAKSEKRKACLPISMAKKKLEHRQAEFFGPYTEGGAVKRLLRSLRKTFPYCTCKNLHARPCQQAELGLCAGACCSKTYEIDPRNAVQTHYKKNIRYIKNILTGRQHQLLARLQTNMRRASKNRNFETAAHLRDQTYALERIFAHKHILKKDFAAENQKGLHELRMLLELSKKPQRMEGYDISNIQGAFAVGSMVVFTDGTADKNAYRKFRIRTVMGANDPAMMHEVLSRRLRHADWPLPDVILIDGGRTQLNAACAAIKKSANPAIPVISIAKREEELYVPDKKTPFKLKEMPVALLYLLQQIRNESHRFAISYYRKRHRTMATQ